MSPAALARLDQPPPKRRRARRLHLELRKSRLRARALLGRLGGRT